jgi:hypothetical protein
VTRLTTRNAATWYVLLMALWVYGFGVIDRELPALLVFLLLLGAGGIHVGAGYLIGRWEALVLAAVPVLLALAIAGFGSTLWVTILLLAFFPGAPLIGAGVYLGMWLDERDDRSPDSWLYGERPNYY